jgi:hypothetical protein
MLEFNNPLGIRAAKISYFLFLAAEHFCDFLQLHSPPFNPLPIPSCRTTTMPETNGSTTNCAVSMSTLPQEGHDWQVSLKGKVIASTITLLSFSFTVH